jgi:hypothetical protein
MSAQTEKLEEPPTDRNWWKSKGSLLRNGSQSRSNHGTRPESQNAKYKSKAKMADARVRPVGSALTFVF